MSEEYNCKLPRFSERPGVLVGNWFEESVIRQCVGEGRTYYKRHRGHAIGSHSNTTSASKLNEVDDTFERVGPSRQLNKHHGHAQRPEQGVGEIIRDHGLAKARDIKEYRRVAEEELDREQSCEWVEVGACSQYKKTFVPMWERPCVEPAVVSRARVRAASSAKADSQEAVPTNAWSTSILAKETFGHGRMRGFVDPESQFQAQLIEFRAQHETSEVKEQHRKFALHEAKTAFESAYGGTPMTSLLPIDELVDSITQCERTKSVLRRFFDSPLIRTQEKKGFIRGHIAKSAMESLVAVMN